MRQRPAAQFDGGEHLRRLRAPDAGDARQIVAGRSHQPVQAAARRQQLVRDGQRVGAAAAAAQHHGDELVVAERRHAVARELLARTIVGRDVFHVNHSLESRERAQTAAIQAGGQKAAARAKAKRALKTASATIAEANGRLKAAETSGAPARRLAAARRSVAASEQAVQKARAAFDQGSFRDVPQALNEPMTRLAATSRDLEAAPRLAARRPR